MERPIARQINWNWQEVIGIRDKKTLSGHQSVFFNRIMDLADPTEEYDAVNKKYVDGKIGPGFVSSGSSTGTGIEQTIAHSLAAIPTGCKAWIKYLVGARYHTEEIDFDATNVYPTVPLGVAYEWRIE
jgi:hypothetical protein